MSPQAESAMSTKRPNFAVPISQEDKSSPARTPSARSPTKRISRGISLAQKQAILDNLQQEITVRARRLRAQYGTQAEGLRTRVEFRVNRIPHALRKQKLGDLLKQYSDDSAKPSGNQSTASLRSPLKESQGSGKNHSPENSRRNNKRPSDEISTDKENEDVTNPKKRQRGPAGALKTSHPDPKPSRVLSPKSSNSQIQPKTQTTRATQLGKSQLARPASPLKPTGASGIINNFMEKAKSTRAGTTRKAAVPPAPPPTTTGAGRGGRKPPVSKAPTKTARGRASNASESSNTSSGTTIVTKPAAAANKVPAKRTVMSTIKGIGASAAGKKAAAPKAAVPTAGRVLRKRN